MGDEKKPGLSRKELWIVGIIFSNSRLFCSSGVDNARIIFTYVHVNTFSSGRTAACLADGA